MKRFSFLLIALVMTMAVSAQNKHLSALFSYSTFYLPESNQPYVETYLDFNARSLNFEPVEEGFRATVEVTIAVRSADTVAYFKKYNLLSPVTSSENATNFTFFDLRRFSLPNGIYDIELTLHDKSAKDESYVFNDKLVVFFQKNKPALSNIQFMSSVTPTDEDNMLSRNGFDMVPYIDDFFPVEKDRINAYFETYNLDRELGTASFQYVVSIEQKESGRRIKGFDTVINRSIAESYDPVFVSLDIANLPSGNYNLVVEACYASGETLLKSKAPFQRSNPNVAEEHLIEDAVATSFAGLIKNEEELDYYISALYPIAGPIQNSAASDLLHNGAGLSEKQTFFYRFWLARDPIDPAGAWREYHTRLLYVDQHFSYPKTPGYQTDMGRVYLQYGPPDFVRDEKNFVAALNQAPTPSISGNLNTSDTYLDYTVDDSKRTGQIHYLPYQLWRYNLLPGDVPNRVFIFWDEFRSGIYKILNSSARGELRTYYWERMLSQNQLEENVVGEVGKQFERGY